MPQEKFSSFRDGPEPMNTDFQKFAAEIGLHVPGISTTVR
jgi:hypothetical protein